MGYAWLWSGPYHWEESQSCEKNLMPRWDTASGDWICVAHVESMDGAIVVGHASLDEIDETKPSVTSGPSKIKAKRIAYKEYMPYAQPDTRLIFLRLLAATTICVALFVTAGLWRRGLLS